MADRCTGVATPRFEDAQWIARTFGGRLVADEEGSVTVADVWRAYRAETGVRARSPLRRTLLAEMLTRNTVLRRSGRLDYLRGVRLADPSARDSTLLRLCRAYLVTRLADVAPPSGYLLDVARSVTPSTTTLALTTSRSTN